MKLFFLTHQYPGKEGEYFIDEEMKILKEHFDQICIISDHSIESSDERFIPDNAIFRPVQSLPSMKNKLVALLHLSSPAFWPEWRKIINQASSWKAFKIALMDMAKALQIKKALRELLKGDELQKMDMVFYSYWHDYMALALAMLRSENKNLKCLSRAHGWDLFPKRHQVPYLPFKSFINTNLSLSLSVSDTGRKALEEQGSGKIGVSRLGSPPIPSGSNKSEDLIICSCSNIVEIKRLHLVVDILSHLESERIHWVHFGDGPLKGEIMDHSNSLSKKIRVEFKGQLANADVRKFYEEHHVAIFLNVSRDEGIPVSIMEAMSAGIPVMACNVGGIPEIVDQRNGLLIPRDFSPAEIALQLDQWLNRPEEDHEATRSAAMNTWKEKYQASVNYAAFVKLIKSLDA